MSTAYLASLHDALTDCQRAHAEAEASLTEEVRREYQLLRVHTVEAWNALLTKYPHDRAIEALEIIAEFAVKVQSLQVRLEADARPIDLTLGKVRPGHGGHGR
jgi:hypothetical protein